MAFKFFATVSRVLEDVIGRFPKIYSHCVEFFTSPFRFSGDV